MPLATGFGRPTNYSVADPIGRYSSIFLQPIQPIQPLDVRPFTKYQGALNTCLCILLRSPALTTSQRALFAWERSVLPVEFWFHCPESSRDLPQHWQDAEESGPGYFSAGNVGKLAQSISASEWLPHVHGGPHVMTATAVSMLISVWQPQNMRRQFSCKACQLFLWN